MAWLALTGGDSYQATRNVGPSMGDSGYRVGTEGRGRDNDSALGLSLWGVQGHDLEGWLDALPKQCLRCPRVAWPLSWPLWPVLDTAQPRPSHSQEGWLDAPVAISVNIVPTPTPLPDVPEPTPNVVEAVPPDPIAAFVAGYRAFSGSPAWEAQFLMVVECESHWDPYAVSPGGHRGLAQFEPGTWATVAALTGLWDWTDAYSQGANTAVWSSMV